MKIYLIRHGEKEGHGFEAPLTELGKKQMLNLAKKTKHFLPKKVFSSSNPRSVESAKILSEEINSELKIVEALKEFERSTFFREINSLEETEKNNLNFLHIFLEDIQQNKEDVVLVMNAGINRAIMCKLFNFPLSEAIAFTQDFGSITELELKEIRGEKKWCLNSINQKFE